MKLRGSREGVSLVELMIAVVLVGVAVTTLGGMSFQAARQSVTLAGDGYMQGIVTQEVNRLQAIPFDQLNAGSVCVTVTTGSFPHTRCYKVTSVSVTEKTVVLAVTPSQTRVRPMTITFSRYQPSNYNPLNNP